MSTNIDQIISRIEAYDRTKPLVMGDNLTIGVVSEIFKLSKHAELEKINKLYELISDLNPSRAVALHLLRLTVSSADLIPAWETCRSNWLTTKLHREELLADEYGLTSNPDLHKTLRAAVTNDKALQAVINKSEKYENVTSMLCDKIGATTLEDWTVGKQTNVAIADIGSEEDNFSLKPIHHEIVVKSMLSAKQVEGIKGIYGELRFREVLEEFLPKEFIEKALGEYALNDAAHLQDHAVNVVLEADKIIDRFEELWPYRRVILTAALLHDVKCHVNRDKHHILGALAVFREYLLGNDKTKDTFTAEEITMIEEAVLEHRASWKHKRSHDVSECVAAADRGKPDLFSYMRRAIRYRYAQVPAGTVMSEESIRRIVHDSVTHMSEKFGDHGYAWNTIPKYTKLMYDREIESIQDSVTRDQPIMVLVGMEHFNEWVGINP